MFVVDGTPSPLKSQARIARFFQASGIHLSKSPAIEDDVSPERNKTFTKYVKECVVEFPSISYLCNQVSILDLKWRSASH